MIRIGCNDGEVRSVAGRSASPRRDAQRGATILAAAIGVFAAGIAVALAVPPLQNAVRKARATAVVAALRDFARAFESHARQHRSWPPATLRPGEVPAGMASRLGPRWSQRPSGGFRYLWAPASLQRGRRYRAAIVLARDNRPLVPDERRLFEEIDRQLDDGELLSGKFQLGYRDQPFLVIER